MSWLASENMILYALRMHYENPNIQYENAYSQQKMSPCHLGITHSNPEYEYTVATDLANIWQSYNRFAARSELPYPV